jgi:hypothetical protein
VSKFGLIEDDPEEVMKMSLSERLTAFPAVSARHIIDVAAADAAAAPHGFTSREPARLKRKRRTLATEPTRHLAIRCPQSLYDRFVAYADRHRCTYTEAIEHLLNLDVDATRTD